MPAAPAARRAPRPTDGGPAAAQGGLALALELTGTKSLPVVGDKANLTLSAEVGTLGALQPKLGAMLQLAS